MKSGFVSIIGLPNVGKSTITNLLNAKKISIVTPKAQTTRNNILSIIDNENYQILLYDTPGLNNTKTELGVSMNKQINQAIKDGDILVLVVSPDSKIDVTSLSGFINKNIQIIVLNKIDLINIVEVEKYKENIKKLFPRVTIIEMCAKDKFNIDLLLNSIVEKLPEGPKYYPDPNVIKDDKFYAKEIIREKLLFALKNEVPHNIAVNIKGIKQKKESVLIDGEIIVSKESHKSIVIGKSGMMIKKIGTNARKELENYFNKSVYLNLNVKVKKDWLNSRELLKEFGY